MERTIFIGPRIHFGSLKGENIFYWITDPGWYVCNGSLVHDPRSVSVIEAPILFSDNITEHNITFIQKCRVDLQ